MIRLDENLATALVAAIIATGVISLVLAWAYPKLCKRLAQVEPAARSWIILGLMVAPLSCGLVLAGVTLTPVMDYGPITHHCHYQSVPGCVPHVQTALTEVLSLGLVVLIAAILSLPLYRFLSSLWKLRRIGAHLNIGGRRDQDTGVYLVDDRRPAAFSLGLFSPHIFVSTGLRDALNRQELEIVARHEWAHRKRKDSLRSLIGWVFALGHLPKVKRLLREDLHLAAEQACDAEAAHVTGDRLDVAAVILKVERLYWARGACVPEDAHSLTGSCIPVRVNALMAGEDVGHPPMLLKVSAMMAALIGMLFLSAEPLHHLIEDTIQPLLG